MLAVPKRMGLGVDIFLKRVGLGVVTVDRGMLAALDGIGSGLDMSMVVVLLSGGMGDVDRLGVVQSFLYRLPVGGGWIAMT